MSADKWGRKRNRPLAERFWEKVAVVGECWEWTASKKPSGYGEFKVDGRLVRAHRFAYEDMVAEIPAGLFLDHLCRNRACVRPEHLEPVTALVNVRRAIPFMSGHKNTCPQGHAYSPENTYVRRQGWRECRTCKRDRDAAVRGRRAA